MGVLWHSGIRTNLIVSTAFPFHLAQARNAVKQYAETEYVLMLDNDVVIPPRGLESMVKFLDGYCEFGAIALAKCPSCVPPILNTDTVSEPAHVDQSCVLWRGDVLKAHVFRTARDYCDCLPTCEDLRSKGVRIGFMPKLICHHHQNTSTLAQRAQDDALCGFVNESPQVTQRVLMDYLTWWNQTQRKKKKWGIF